MNAYARAETERLLANLIRVGTVAALDAAAARVTVDVGGRPLTGCRGSLGALTVQGLLTWQAGMIGTGDAAIAGNVAVAGGLSNNGTNVGACHRHSGVEQGKDTTSGPAL